MGSSLLTDQSRSSLPLRLPCWGLALVWGAGLLLSAGPARAGQLLKQEAGTYRQLGQQFQTEGRIDDAIDAYAKAVLSDPASSAAHNDLGVMYEAKGWLANAEAEYLRALQLNPSDGSAHTNLALLYEQQGRVAEATPHWQRRVTLGPSDDLWAQDARQRLMRHGASVPESVVIAPAKAPKPKKLPTPKPVVVPARLPAPVPVVKLPPPKPVPAAPVKSVAPVVVPARPPAAAAVVKPAPAPAPKRIVVPVKPAVIPRVPAAVPTISRREQQAIVRQEIALRKATAEARRREARQREQALQQQQRAAQQRRQGQERALKQQQREAERLAKERARQVAAQKPAAAKLPVPKPVVVPMKPTTPAVPRPLIVSANSAPREGGAAKALERPSGHGVERSETSKGVRVAKSVSLGPTSVPERPTLEAGRQQPVVPVTTAAQATALVDQIARERQRARDLMARELYQRGLILYRQQQYARAIEQFRRALEIDPNHRESQQYLREAQTALARGGK